MLGTKSNLPRRVLALFVVLQANYQNTLTYLQCKVFTAERNIGNIGSFSGHLPVMDCMTSESRLSDRRIKCLHSHNTSIALLGAGWMNTYQYFREHCWCLEANQRNSWANTKSDIYIYYSTVSCPTRRFKEQMLCLFVKGASVTLAIMVLY